MTKPPFGIGLLPASIPVLFLSFIMVCIYIYEPQHEDEILNSGWVEVKIQTVSGEIVTLSCPQKRGRPAGSHSVDCYVKLENKL